MPIQVVCENGHKGRVRDELAGKRIKCPRCSQPIAVPMSTAASGRTGTSSGQKSRSEADTVTTAQAPPAETGRRGMLKGYWIVLAGVGGFLAAVALGNAVDPQGAAGDLLLYAAVLLLFLGFWLGAAFIAFEKGYHIAIGLGLGLVAPLGLLVLTVLSDRTVRPT